MSFILFNLSIHVNIFLGNILLSWDATRVHSTPKTSAGKGISSILRVFLKGAASFSSKKRWVV